MSSIPNSTTDCEADLRREPATILLAEDEVAVRKVIRLTLELLGYRVFAAQDAKAALRLVSSHKGSIDLLVADVVMPYLSGPRLFEQLRLTHPDVRVLFISGYSDEVLAEQGVAMKDANFLAKPFSALTLECKVRELLMRPAD